MTRFAAAGLAFALAIGGAAVADEKALKELEGTYKVVSAEKDGKAPPDFEAFKKKASIIIAGDTITFDLGKDEVAKSGKLKADASKKPAEIDITPSEGPEKGKTFPGIYKLEKGTLTLVWKEAGDRPTAFSSGNGAAVLVLKRGDE
jgi:uncharacterized protein (TIGR03067 family)